MREKGAISLMDAIRKMSLLPAQRLEDFVPAMRHKGRVQIGADADLVVFDPTTVASGAKYLDAKQFSKGFEYVTVNGSAPRTIIVEDRERTFDRNLHRQP